MRLEIVHFQAYLHVCAVMWRTVFRELRALTNDNGLELNPLELNDLYEHLWAVGNLLKGPDALEILEDEFRPWPKVRIHEVFSQKFYEVHDRKKTEELTQLRLYENRLDHDTYKVVLFEVFVLFGEGIHESLTRTMGHYLEATHGEKRNSNLTEWEVEVASKLICTNNPAERPFAVVKAFHHLYPTMTLLSLRGQSQALLNGTHRPADTVGKKNRKAGLALTADPKLRRTITELCSVRKRKPGPIVSSLAAYNKADMLASEERRKERHRMKLEQKENLAIKKMIKFNNAESCDLASDVPALRLHLQSFRANVAAGKLEYLKAQYNARYTLRGGIYHSIPHNSEYRSNFKPHKLKMTPPEKSTVKEAVSYLQGLVEAMMLEDSERPSEPLFCAEDIGLVRTLPVISLKYLDPLSVKLKAEQVADIAVDSAPVDDIWLVKLSAQYIGTLLLDRGHYYRCFNVQYVGNEKSQSGLFACWEATCEPVVKTDGLWNVPDQHFVVDYTTGHRCLKEQSTEGFTVADYRNGNNEDPVWDGNYADICIKRFEKKEAQLLLSSSRKRTRERRSNDM
jgi:hypothetical protein